MTQSVEFTGMVLSAMPLGEYDKRITILTREAGKITAFARGARRPNARLIAAANPFVFGTFELTEGKNAYSLIRANVHNYFRELTENVDAAYMGFYFLEFASYFCQEGNDERLMLKLLYQSLRALESPAFSPQLVRLVFELKALGINGIGPEVFSCIRCRKAIRSEGRPVFLAKRGGMFCVDCAAGENGRVLQESTLYTMQFILSTPVEKLYTFRLSDSVLGELESVVREYMDCHVSHKFKSLDVLESL